MRNTLDRIIIAVFAAILLAPALVFLIGGPTAGYEGGRATQLPSLGSIISPKPDRREVFAEALFERSWFRREAVRFKNALFLNWFGSVETEKVVSGAPSWLFLKEQFERFDCANHDKLRDELRRFIIMAEFAEANAAPVIFVVAPNKASVERSAVAGRAARFRECYYLFADEWRSIVRASGVQNVVDHADVLSDSAGGVKTYMNTDTHWTFVGGVTAFAQLQTQHPVALPQQPEVKRESPGPIATDLRNRMLGLPGREMERQVHFGPRPEGADASRTLIVHDSFYGRIRRYFDDVAPNAHFINLNKDKFQDSDLRDIDVLVLESVERAFLNRAIRAYGFGWGSSAGTFLFRHAQETAEYSCDWKSARNVLASVSAADSRRAEVRDAAVRTTARDPQVFLAPLSTLGGPCVSIDIELPAPGALQLFISTEDAPERRFTEGASIIRRLPAGRHTVRFIMPPSARDRALRFDPGPGPGARVAAFDLAPLN